MKCAGAMKCDSGFLCAAASLACRDTYVLRVRKALSKGAGRTALASCLAARANHHAALLRSMLC